MLNKFVDVQDSIEKAQMKVHFSKGNPLNNGRAKQTKSQNPEVIINATEEALKDLSAILIYFKDNFLDTNGKIIKVSFWKWVFKKEYRNKISNAIDFIFDKIKVIAMRFIH